MKLRLNFLCIFLILCILLSISSVFASDDMVADGILNSPQSDMAISEINDIYDENDYNLKNINDNNNVVGDDVLGNDLVNEDVVDQNDNYNSEGVIITDESSQDNEDQSDILKESSKTTLKDDASNSFVDLAEKIDNANENEVIIEGTYVYDDEKDSIYRDGLVIAKDRDFKIIGNNLIINGSNLGTLKFSGTHNIQLINVTIIDCAIYNNADLAITGNITGSAMADGIHRTNITNYGNLSMYSHQSSDSVLKTSDVFNYANITFNGLEYHVNITNSTISNFGGNMTFLKSNTNYYSRLINKEGIINASFTIFSGILINDDVFIAANFSSNAFNVSNSGSILLINHLWAAVNLNNTGNISFIGVDTGGGTYYNYGNLNVSGSYLRGLNIYNNASFETENSTSYGSDLINDNLAVLKINNLKMFGGSLNNTLGFINIINMSTENSNLINSIGSAINLTNSSLRYYTVIANDGNISFYERNLFDKTNISSNNYGVFYFESGNYTINNTNLTKVHLYNTGNLSLNYTYTNNSKINNTGNINCSISAVSFANSHIINVNSFSGYASVTYSNVTNEGYFSIRTSAFCNISNYGDMKVNFTCQNTDLKNYGDFLFEGIPPSSTSVIFTNNLIENHGNMSVRRIDSPTFSPYDGAIINYGNFSLGSLSYTSYLSYYNFTNYGNLNLTNTRLYYRYLINDGGNVSANSTYFGYNYNSYYSYNLTNNGGNIISENSYYYGNITNSGNFTSIKGGIYGPSYSYYNYGKINNSGNMNITSSLSYINLNNSGNVRLNGIYYVNGYPSNSYSASNINITNINGSVYVNIPLSSQGNNISNSNGFISLSGMTSGMTLQRIRINNTDLGVINLTRVTINNWSDINNDASSSLNFVNSTVSYSGWTSFGNISFENGSISQVWIYNREKANLTLSGKNKIYQANVFIGNLINNGELESSAAQFMPSNADFSTIENNGKFRVSDSNITARINNNGTLSISRVLLKSELIKNTGNMTLSSISLNSTGIKNEGNLSLSKISMSNGDIYNNGGNLNLSATSVTGGDIVNNDGNLMMSKGNLSNVDLVNNGGNLSFTDVNMSDGKIVNTGNMTLDHVSISSVNVTNDGILNASDSDIDDMGILNTGDINVDGGSVNNVGITNNGGTISGTNGNVSSNVKEIDSIVAKNISTDYGSGVFFSAVFSDVLGNKLAYERVSFIVDGKSYSVYTDSKGYAYLNYQLSAGKHNVEVVNPVVKRTEKYTFTIKKISTSVRVNSIVENYGDRKYLTIKLTDKKGKVLSGVMFKVKFNGKAYNLLTKSDGTIRFKIPVLRIGTYGVSISSVSQMYDIQSKKTTIKINKAKTVVKAPKAKYKAKKSRYYKFSVKSKVTKKFVKGVKVKVKVYTGKKFKVYKLKTNKNGVAKFNTKKLKKGKHKVVISSLNKNYVISKKSLITII